MKRVQLIVTGDMERKGLASGLTAIFPTVVFEALKVESCTSGRWRELREPAPVPTALTKLAAAIVAGVDPGRATPGSERFDLVIAIDDLEIANHDQPDVVVSGVSRAVDRYVDECWSNQDRRAQCRERLRERASFHLLVPMTESYFFGCELALKAAGVARPHSFDPAVTDLEEFAVDDSDYRIADAALDAAKHPKRYLKYLVSRDDPTAHYRETKGGAAALSLLEWERVLARNREWATFARSFLCDLARAIGEDPVRFAGREHESTSGPPGVLRNC